MISNQVAKPECKYLTNFLTFSGQVILSCTPAEQELYRHDCHASGPDVTFDDK